MEKLPALYCTREEDAASSAGKRLTCNVTCGINLSFSFVTAPHTLIEVALLSAYDVQ